MSRPDRPSQSLEAKRERQRQSRRRKVAGENVCWCPCGWPCRGPRGLKLHRHYMHREAA